MNRTMDAGFLNSIANLPEVRPSMGGEGPIDMTALLANPFNYGFVNDEGGFVVVKLFGPRYECHTIFNPMTKNPRSVLELMHEAIAYMFTATSCDEIVTKVLDSNAGANRLAMSAGFAETFSQKGVSYRNLPLDAWVRSCSTIVKQGRAFHDQLEAAKIANGSALPVHPEDEGHDRAVGAAFAMIRAGNVAKGVDYYNRWAAFSGYVPISLLSAIPVVVDVVDAVVGLRGDTMEVLQCR